MITEKDKTSDRAVVYREKSDGSGDELMAVRLTGIIINRSVNKLTVKTEDGDVFEQDILPGYDIGAKVHVNRSESPAYRNDKFTASGLVD